MRSLITLLCSWLSLMPAASAAQILSYSARIYDAQDRAVDGTFEVRVRIYAEPIGGAPVFQQDFSGVTVTQGRVQVVLTDNALTSNITDPLDAAALFDDATDRFFEMHVDGEVLSPRVRVGSTPAALSVHGALPTAFNGLSGVPTRLTAIGALDCTPGEVLEWTGSAWTCGNDEVAGGPTGSTPWSSLANVPPVLQSLATVSCAPGQVLVKSGSGFVCGADAPFSGSVAWGQVSSIPNGLTQLAALSCGNGTILEWNGGAWVCGTDDGGGTPVSSVSVGTALLRPSGATGAVQIDVDPAAVFTTDATTQTQAAAQGATARAAGVLTALNTSTYDGGDTVKAGLSGRAYGDSGTKVGAYGLAGGTAHTDDLNVGNVGVRGEASQVDGVSFGAVGSVTGGQTMYGAYGLASGATTNYGVYGEASGAGSYAGFFSGDVRVTGTLTVGGTVQEATSLLSVKRHYIRLSASALVLAYGKAKESSLRFAGDDYVWPATPTFENWVAGYFPMMDTIPDGAVLKEMTCRMQDAPGPDYITVELHNPNWVAALYSEGGSEATVSLNNTVVNSAAARPLVYVNFSCTQPGSCGTPSGLRLYGCTISY